MVDSLVVFQQVSGFVLATISFTNEVAALSSGVSASEFVQSLATRLRHLKTFNKVSAVLSVVITIGIATGFFIASVVEAGLDPNGLEFTRLLFETLASVIVTVLFVALGLIPVVGPLITSIVFAIDAVITLACRIAGVDANNNFDDASAEEIVCSGISGILERIVTYLIYGNHPLVDIAADGRLEFVGLQQDLIDPDGGIAMDNGLRYELDVETTISADFPPRNLLGRLYPWQFANIFIRDSAFAYRLQNGEQDFHNSVDLGDTNWQNLGGSDVAFDEPGGGSQLFDDRFFHHQSVESNEQFFFPAAGVNVPMDNLKLSEAYAMHAQECFILPVFFSRNPRLLSAPNQRHYPSAVWFVACLRCLPCYAR